MRHGRLNKTEVEILRHGIGRRYGRTVRVKVTFSTESKEVSALS